MKLPKIPWRKVGRFAKWLLKKAIEDAVQNRKEQGQ